MYPKYFYEPAGVPVFEPTLQEFEDFSTFVKSIENYGYKAGLVKIVPPKEWREALTPYEQFLDPISINRPICQEFNPGGLPSGAYRQLNIETPKKYSVQEWMALCQSQTYSTPDVDKLNRNEDKENESFSDDHLKLLERFYWRNLPYSTPMYGADLNGSLFDPKKKNSWNIAKLNSYLSKIKDRIPGVNTPYLYFGMWKASFAWHVEDMNLFSINYIHGGAPKQWYVVPPEHAKRFERFASGLFTDEAKVCPEFLRHKTCVISPKLLAQNSIPVHRLVQYEGEIVITFPAAYHAGYNVGFNVAESTNFALESWISIGKEASYCKCVKDSVRLKMNDVVEESNEDSEQLRKRPKYISKAQDLDDITFTQPTEICDLCSKGPEFEPLLKTSLGGFSHRFCAQAVQETWVAKVGRSNSPDDIVEGLQLIDKEKWKLRCCFCRKNVSARGKPTGICIQCSSGKCSRSFHPSCAKENDIWMKFEKGALTSCFCSAHNPEKIEERKRKKLSQIPEVQPDDRIVAKIGGAYYDVIVNSVSISDGGCNVSFANSLAPPFFLPFSGIRVARN